MFVDVAINIPSYTLFTYSVPEAMRDAAEVGKRVLVPFGKRKLTGYLTNIHRDTEVSGTKDIIAILDDTPLFSEDDADLYKWISEYYIYPPGKTFREILPGGLDITSDCWITLADDYRPIDEKCLSAAGKCILNLLKKGPARGLSISHLKKKTDNKNVKRDIDALKELGLVTLDERLKKASVSAKQITLLYAVSPPPGAACLSDKQRKILERIKAEDKIPLTALRETFDNVTSSLKGLEKKGFVKRVSKSAFRSPASSPSFGTPKKEITLNDEQEQALESIVDGITSRHYSPFVLHGITGSGKTEVYLKAMERNLQRGDSTIFLVPEIGLTPQLLSRLKDRFHEKDLALLHSGISRSVRYDEWRRIIIGEARIVVGARSAVFAPVNRLRLIIVDEEYDASYKQDTRLPYNARDVAVLRAKRSNATVVLGSATPELQTYFNIDRKDYRCLKLEKRHKNRPLPSVRVVDLKNEFTAEGRTSIISKPLEQEISKNLERGEQTILFLNRRGFDTFLYCRDCGYSFKCPNCSVSLTHHSGEKRIKCHYCDFGVKAPPLCYACGSTRIGSYGVGTEKLSDTVSTLFPAARIVRMDSDSTASKESHTKILSAFDRKELDILIGTQMVTKGHDFPGVTLVGVISADTSLNMPDFRAAERTFQILTQVSGRGGRGRSPGRVIIQTFNPDHYAIRHACSHDYIGFYDEELALRKTLSYPPFARIINIRISGTNATRVSETAKRIGKASVNLITEHGLDLAVMGPTEAPLSKIRGRYRWQLILKGKDLEGLHFLAATIAASWSKASPSVSVDVDPLNFM